jgi:hypothetical protein
MPTTSLKQRADYTQKHNSALGRHGWLRLTPAYSVKIVEEILEHEAPRTRVLDPFAGTATTALCAICRGHLAATTEINPFLVWFARAKTARYTPPQVAATWEAGRSAAALAAASRIEPVPPPALHNIHRWWSADRLRFLCSLKAALGVSAGAAEPAGALLMVAFCRTLIKLSNAAFNHQSMSFREEDRNLSLFDETGHAHGHSQLFLEDLHYVLESVRENPVGDAVVVEGDARQIANLVPGLHDLVVTSPPYPNRMSYIRELRPYMYWLGFLKRPGDAAELDWASIGGTWGAATSRLNDWEPATGTFRPAHFCQILELIADHRNANGRLLSRYVAKYFEDIFSHLTSLREVLSVGARVHYVIGNSTFYGVLLPVERLYADMMSCLGFSGIDIRAIRKRSSKKELVEFVVSGRWK